MLKMPKIKNVYILGHDIWSTTLFRIICDDVVKNMF